MIERMKKLTFLVTNREYDGFIDNIRQLGVVHIDQLQQGATSSEFTQTVELEKHYVAVLDALKKAREEYEGIGNEMSVVAATNERTAGELLEHVDYLLQEESNVQQQMTATQRDIDTLKPWGNFSLDQVEALSERIGYEINFFTCAKNVFAEEWTNDYFATIVSEENKQVYFITFSAQQPDIAAKRVQLPQQSLSELTDQLRRLQDALAKTRHELVLVDKEQRAILEQGHVESQDAIQLSRVHLSDQSVAGDSLRLLCGWVQANRSEELVQYLEAEHIFYEMEDPAFEDDVPVKLTEDKYSRLFLPILGMYSLPKYTEIDPTVFFAPFFMLFFGLCLGDGGYGLIVLLLSWMIVRKGSESIKDYGRLGMWLGGATVVCGLATGTVFGIDLTQQSWSFLAPIKPYLINDHGMGPIFGYSPMMVISVMLGLIQVLLGMGLKAAKTWKNYGFAYAVGTLSWLVALICIVLLYGLPVCGVTLPTVVGYALSGLIGLSCIGIFIYNNPAAYKNPILGPLVNIGTGVYDVYGMATGLLGDLLSYIRLFALGLTGGVLGGVFNSLAVQMTEGLPVYVAWLPFLLILFFGHGITFALSMISAFVHPMRLIFVEFFKNANFEGGGRAYKPFAKQTK